MRDAIHCGLPLHHSSQFVSHGMISTRHTLCCGTVHDSILTAVAELQRPTMVHQNRRKSKVNCLCVAEHGGLCSNWFINSICPAIYQQLQSVRYVSTGKATGAYCT